MEKAQSATAPILVTFYTKAGCHLCSEARDLLDEIASHIIYTLTEIDIRSDDVLFERYRYRIPVIVLNETLVIEGRIEYNQLMQAFKELNSPKLE